MRKGIATLFIAAVLLATSAYAVGVKNTSRPLRTQAPQTTQADTAETLAQRLEASVPRATSLAAPL